jgi:hypothetical protein
MLARLLGASFPSLQHRVPGPHFAGSGQSLHAHVRDFEHGWQRPESQECGREQELVDEAILLQQRTFAR